MYASTLGFSLVAVWEAVNVLHKKDFGQLYFICIPLLLGGVAGFIYLLRHQLILSETTLCQSGFRTKCILLEDIESITENLGSYLIKTDKNNILITKNLQHKDRFKDQVITQFQRIDAVRHSLPGQQLGTEYMHKLVTQIRQMVGADIQNANLVKADISLLEQLVDPAYYIVYEHSTHDCLYRAYDTEVNQVKAFICQHNDSTAAPDIRIWVLPHSKEWLILCVGSPL